MLSNKISSLHYYINNDSTVIYISLKVLVHCAVSCNHNVIYCLYSFLMCNMSDIIHDKRSLYISALSLIPPLIFAVLIGTLNNILLSLFLALCSLL